MNRLLFQPQLHSLSNITWLIPQPGLSIDERVLVQNVEEFQFMDLLIDLTESNLLKDDSLLPNLNDLTALTDPLMKGLVLSGIGNIHSYFGNYAKSFSAFHQALNTIQGHSDPEALAFVYSSMSNLLRKLGHREATLVLAEEVIKLSKTEFMKWRARVQRSLAGKYGNEWRKTVSELRRAVRYYESIHNAFRMAGIQRHLAHIYARQNEYNTAEQLLDQAENIARQENRIHFLHEIKNDRGYLHFLQKHNRAARATFSELIREAPIPYQEALVYQNLGLVEIKEKNFRAAIACFRKSLAITEPNDMRELLLEDYLRLARCYRKIGDDCTGSLLYDKVYQTVLADLEMGLPLNSSRKAALDETVRFLKAHCRLEADDPRYFEGLESSTLAEARILFQRTLLTLHLRQTETLNALARKLRVTPRALHGYRVRLGLQRNSKGGRIRNNHLTSYVEGFLHFSWKEATTHFEDDFIRFALGKQGFNKRKTADHLGISYPQILLKTERHQSKGYLS
ncbi:MAG: hypothetical protein GXO90_06745 [FCB group bacterium]|nr:hypothetical protein [FCB group bacterium]